MYKGNRVMMTGIDPNHDFMGNTDGSPYTDGINVASLPVKGACDDLNRVVVMLDRIGKYIDDFDLSLDAHPTLHVGHGIMWAARDGTEPPPFTKVSYQSMLDGDFRARDWENQERFLKYLQALEKKGAKHTIWPQHGRIGTWGHSVYAPMQPALRRWETLRGRNINYILKGTCTWREHFGLVEAEVIDRNDRSTWTNKSHLERVNQADTSSYWGHALDVCVRRSMQQTIHHLGPRVAKKMVLLTNATSPVDPAVGEQFLAQMKKAGVTLMTTEEFLA